MAADRIRFGDFELDAGGYELRRLGDPVRIERIPMELLLLLTATPGRLIPRSAVVERVWGKDHFLEEEDSNQVPAILFRESGGAPVLMPPVDLLRGLISGSLAFVSLTHT
jgi:hypothetical protein